MGRDAVYPSSDRDEQSLLALDTYQVLNAEQLTRLYYGDSLEWVRGRLATGVAKRFILRDTLSVPRMKGKRSYYYQLSPTGYSYLKARGYALGPRSHHSKKAHPYKYIHVDHTLTINDALIALALLCRTHDGFSLTQMIHEHIWKSPRFYDRVEVRLQGGKTEKLAVVPDAWVQVQTPLGRACRAVEVDMGTAHDADKWRKKIRGYVGWLRSGRYQERFGTDNFGLIAVAPKNEAEAAALVRTTELELKYLGEEVLAPNFHFTSAHPGRMPETEFYLQPHWMDPFDEGRYPLFYTG